MKLQKVTSYGQISPSDLLILQDKRGNIFADEVGEVGHPGQDKEEVILSERDNVYFIMFMYLEGKSWIKECYKVME